MGILEFASGSPWLAFFLSLITLQASVHIIVYTMKYLSIMVRGYPPAKVKRVQPERKENAE